MAAPSPAELDDLSLACQRVWDLDANRLTPGVDYVINLQQPKRAFNQTDVADQNLFTFVNPTVLQRTNYRLYCALLDNYTKITGTAEQGTAVEMKETSDFLDFVIASQPMTYVHKYLVAKQLASPNVAEFKKQLHQMWFSLYSREVRDDSCGFEHVFVGEVDQGKVSGFHNWLQFHLQEARGLSNYGGYLLPRGARGVQEPVDEAERLISIQFGWGAESKDVSSIWIGTSPEFELALYSLCFLAGQEENLVQIAGYQVKIRCYRIRSKYGDKVGSTFPELLSKIPGARIEAVGSAPHNGQHHAGFAAAPAPQHNAWQQPHQAQQAAGHQQEETQPWNTQQYQPQHPQQNGYAPQNGHVPQGYPQQAQQPACSGPPQHAQQGPPQDTAHQGCGDILKMLLPHLKKAFKEFKNFKKATKF